jgi:hypothetical protein
MRRRLSCAPIFKEFSNKVNVCEKHAPAAITVETQLVQDIPWVPSLLQSGCVLRPHVSNDLFWKKIALNDDAFNFYLLPVPLLLAHQVMK